MKFRYVMTVCAALLCGSAAAQTFPSKPIRLVVPYPPGGAVDALARPIGQKMQEQMGQPIIIENRPGANATIGSDHVAKSPPDGHTFLLSTVVHYMVPYFSKNVPYDPVRDFIPVSQVTLVPNILAVHPSLPVNNVKELIDYVKKSGQKLHYGTTGTGTTHHLGGILLAQSAGIPLEHVPYKGGVAAIQDVLSGSIKTVILTAVSVLPQVKNGKLRALAVIDNRRFASVAGVPTIAESLPAFVMPDTWFGFFLAAGTPAPIVDRINSEIRRAMKDPDIRKRIENLGMEVTATDSAAEVAANVKADIQAIQKIVRDAGIKPE